MAKAKAVKIRITGSVQTSVINTVYDAKAKADKAKKEYDEARKTAVPIITSKVVQYWKKAGVKTGKYSLEINGNVRNVNVSNRQNSVVIEPEDVSEVMTKLNENCETKLKPSDVVVVASNRTINPEVMAKPAIRNKILETLVALEAEMKKAGEIPPEVSIVEEVKQVKLAPHAVERVVALSDDPNGALAVIGSPVTVSLTK